MVETSEQKIQTKQRPDLMKGEQRISAAGFIQFIQRFHKENKTNKK